MIGETLSHFRITAKLGEGGMGEVYRAEDLSLKREVALKMLPAEVAADPRRLERFQREAEAVAALNHPNIVTIYSVEREGDTPFIAMELVEGESLDRALPRGGFSLPKALNVALEIAEALTAAHDRGVVHRDLKPANVMLTADGRIKVLDFGLAKLASDTGVAPEDLTEMPTEVAPLTGEGMVLGTAPYMSPEQAQGKMVDQRSDIFSLGSILYEAATGVRPFPGESSIDTLHKVIHEDPAPLDEKIPQAPQQLQWILRKALAKSPGDRYQTARDLAVDLRTLTRDLASDSVQTAPGTAPLRPQTEPGSRSGRSRALVIGAAVVALAAILYWTLGRQPAPSADTVPATTQMTIRPITSSGLVTAAALSPDGRYVAYVESDQGRQSLHLRQVDGPQTLELVPRSPIGFWGLRFVPDGTAIVYGAKGGANPLGAFYRISTLGGQPRKLVEGQDTLPTFSPDGTRMAWLRAQHPEASQSALMVAAMDGSDATVLTAVSAPDVLAPRFFTAPSWSPDGSLIAASILRTESPQGARVVAFDAETGKLVWTAEHTWPWAAAVEWLADGSGLLVIGERENVQVSQIWLVPYPEGDVRLVTNDLLEYRIVNQTADGSGLLTIPSTRSSTIWSRPTDGSGRAQRISHSSLDGLFGFSVAPDGRIVYQTLDTGQLDLAIMDPDGSNRRLLTTDPDEDQQPIVLDDRILWTSRGPTGISILQMDLDGNNRRVVYTGSLSPRSRPSATASAGIVFELHSDGYPTLWRLPPGADEPERLTDYESFYPAISPDGERLAFGYRTDEGRLQVGVTGIEGGAPEMSLRLPVSTASGSYFRWTPDGSALFVNTVAGDRANLWRISLDGGDPERLTDFADQRFGWVDFSPDGETMYYARWILSRDAVLIENFR